MAVSAESLAPKSSPDAPKLAAMARRLVFVTRIMRGHDQSIITGTGDWANASVAQILALWSEMQQRFGNGIYRFTVWDAEGAGEKVEWTARVGAETNEAAPAATAAPVEGGAVASSIRQIGSLTYDSETGILTNRGGQAYQWRPGQPLPSAFSGEAPHVAATLLPTAGGGVEELLRLERDQRREEERKRELGDLAKMIDESNKRFERLFEKLSAPRGPSEEVTLLKAQLEEQRRSMEAQKREDTLRAEIAKTAEETKNLVRELQGNRSDPMITLLQQIITTMQASATAQSSSVKDVAQLIADRMSGSTMSPERMMEMIRLAKDRGADAEVMKNALDMYKQLFGMSQDVLKMQAEMAQGDKEPWYQEMGREALAGVGRLTQAVAANREAQAAQTAQQIQLRQRAEATARARATAAAQQRQRQQAPVTGTVVTPPPPASAAAPPANGAKPKKNGNGKRPVAAPAKPAAPEVIDLRAVSVEDLRQSALAYTDEELFGPFHSHVDNLRQAVAAGLGADKAAEAIASSRLYFQSAGVEPPAAEMLKAEQFEVLVDRLLPESDADFRASIVTAMRGDGTDEDDGGDDDEQEAPASA